MAALSNKDFKEGWIDGYYPYTQYSVIDNKVILSGNERYINKETLTQEIIKDSQSGYNNNSKVEQTGGNIKKKYKIKADNYESAFKKLEGKIKGGNGDFIILKLESLDNKNKINFYKIYRKKI